MSNKFDLIIIGGGIMATSVAYNLLQEGYTGSIAIFEKDQLYEYASTPRSEGGIRQTFSTEVNIRLSKYSYQMYKNFESDMSVDGDPCQIDFIERGYLYLLNEKTMPVFESIIKLQEKLGVKSQVMNQQGLKEFFPELNVEDLMGAVLDPEAGNADPYSVLQAYIKNIKSKGVTFIHDEVDTISTERKKVTGVKTVLNDSYEAPIIVNAAGPWAGEVSEKIGIELPVKPLKRQLFSVDTAQDFSKDVPFTFDPTGMHFRGEGDKLVIGLANDVPYGYDYRLEKSFFEEEIWPILAHRAPIFEQLKVERGWAGLYDYNVVDQNAVIGGSPEMSGYYVISGFSGHGFQQAPAAGKGLAELIVYGEYKTIDLRPLSIERFKTNKLVLETAVY